MFPLFRTFGARRSLSSLGEDQEGVSRYAVAMLTRLEAEEPKTAFCSQFRSTPFASASRRPDPTPTRIPIFSFLLLYVCPPPLSARRTTTQTDIVDIHCADRHRRKRGNPPWPPKVNISRLSSFMLATNRTRRRTLELYPSTYVAVESRTLESAADIEIVGDDELCLQQQRSRGPISSLLPRLLVLLLTYFVHLVGGSLRIKVIWQHLRASFIFLQAREVLILARLQTVSLGKVPNRISRANRPLKAVS